jgi:hypothetical protein
LNVDRQGRRQEALLYFAWAAESHPISSRVALRATPADTQLLAHRIERLVSVELRRGRTWESDPRQVLLEPREYLGADDDEALSVERQTRDYLRLMGAFLGGFNANEAAAEWLVALAVRGGVNRRLAINGYLRQADFPLAREAGEVPTESMLSDWAEMVRAERIVFTARLEYLAKLYASQSDWAA